MSPPLPFSERVLLITSRRVPPLVPALFSHSVQVEATCLPSRRRSIRLAAAGVPAAARLQQQRPRLLCKPPSRRQENQGASADRRLLSFAAATHAYVRHAPGPRAGEKSSGENVITKHCNPLWPVIVIHQNPPFSAFQKWSVIKWIVFCTAGVRGGKTLARGWLHGPQRGPRS